jgi:hypothetical protein
MIVFTTVRASNSTMTDLLSPSSKDSMIYSANRRGSRPTSWSAVATVALRLPVANCVRDKFTATVNCFGHSVAVRHASCNYHFPILSMSRKSSAVGMKTDGEISFPSSAGRRTSASKPMRRRPDTWNTGW